MIVTHQDPCHGKMVNITLMQCISLTTVSERRADEPDVYDVSIQCNTLVSESVGVVYFGQEVSHKSSEINGHLYGPS